MPTENRSSNADPRDVFIRLNPLGLGEAYLRKDSTGFEDPRTHSDYLLFLAGYRETHAEPQANPEPIAWMVGTAFWWTKEEAERDAAATGLPIVGLGPMSCAAPADERQGEPVAYLITPPGCSPALVFARDIGRPSKYTTPLYTHADPGEVDRLRAENEAFDAGMRNLACQLSAGGYNSESLTADQLLEKVQWGLTNLTEAQARLVDGLRAQRAERDALLTKMKALFRVDDPFDLYDAVCAVLSAKAEPSESTPQAVNGHRLYCKAVDDYRPGKCSCGVEIDHDIPGTSFQRLNALANQGE